MYPLAILWGCFGVSTLCTMVGWWHPMYAYAEMRTLATMWGLVLLGIYMSPPLLPWVALVMGFGARIAYRPSVTTSINIPNLPHGIDPQAAVRVKFYIGEGEDVWENGMYYV